MKIRILIFIICVHYCTSQYVGILKKTIYPYPKKVRPGLTQYNNAGKYFKTLKEMNTNGKEYTAFPKPFPTSFNIDTVHHQIVPDSPYFPVDEVEQTERRSRVKKILPEYPLPARHKRSADVKVEAEVVEDKKETRVLTPSLSSKPTHTLNKLTEPSLSPVSKIVDSKEKTTSKKLEKSVKNGDGKVSKLRSHKKPKSNSRKGKKKGEKKSHGEHVSGIARDKKSRGHRYDRTNKKVSRPKLSRSRNLKTSHKKLKQERDTDTVKSVKAPKKLKSNRSHRIQKLRNKNEKRENIPAGHRNSTSKLRGARAHTPKGPNGRRLIAARDAMIEEYPYTISIQKDDKHWCSGAILNPRLIITTANCLWRSTSISRLRVRVGSRHTDRGGQVAKIQEVMKHPGWKVRKNPDNDIALAVLDRNIRFSHSVHGVDLPNRIMLPPFDDAWVTSWGAERRDGIFDERAVNLQVYHARLLDSEKCNNITQRFAVQVTDNFICLSQSGTRAPCTRDTGAPAVSDGVLWGLASWGIRKLCGKERYPAVFSYTASPSNMNFIINATHYLMAEERNYPFLDRYPIKKFSYPTPKPKAET